MSRAKSIRIKKVKKSLYDDGYEVGYGEGYEVGYIKGRDEGYVKGWQDYKTKQKGQK